jgi:hypothetical protein
MMDKKELAAISAVMAIVSEETQPPFVERPEPQIQTAWQSWGARQTMQYRDITQRRIIKRTR